MTDDLAQLERRALDFAKAADFGPEAATVNAAIAERSPKNIAAWTRLGRCHLEQRHFDEAINALRAALALNPTHAVATSLLAEARKRRALAPSAVERATTGFSAREFEALASLPPDAALEALKPRVEAMLESLNASSLAQKILDVRRRHGAGSTRLFPGGSTHSGGIGHIDAFHHGGRWEPQFNVGWFGSTPEWPVNCVRSGLGFNTSAAGRDPDRAAGQDRIVRYFERFQQVVGTSWRNELPRWMAANGGFIQYGARPADVDLLPDRAIERLLACDHPADVGWLFIGRWLFLDRPDDAAILRDRAKLARSVDDTFRALYPIWLGTYSDPQR